ncbi:hypothetical protein L1987_74386 [Smallanthus sonchifolius]|uniref:Uncharacterized protein n=1 Tax=Smallanthus sonchifolius TaxID=185202 RepID=A0ACB9A3S4_9ASTR|nr:hypothetical protein L1987_74386 [Smallanthus sonchifolius]
MGNGMSLEDAVTKLISTTESKALLADSRHRQYKERFSLHEAEFKTQKATLQSIETQLGQIAKLLSERQPGCLLSNTETNLKANISAITLRQPGIVGTEECLVRHGPCLVLLGVNNTLVWLKVDHGGVPSEARPVLHGRRTRASLDTALTLKKLFSERLEGSTARA